MYKSAQTQKKSLIIKEIKKWHSKWSLNIVHKNKTLIINKASHSKLRLCRYSFSWQLFKHHCGKNKNHFHLPMESKREIRSSIKIHQQSNNVRLWLLVWALSRLMLQYTWGLNYCFGLPGPPQCNIIGGLNVSWSLWWGVSQGKKEDGKMRRKAEGGLLSFSGGKESGGWSSKIRRHSDLQYRQWSAEQEMKNGVFTPPY